MQEDVQRFAKVAIFRQMWSHCFGVMPAPRLG